ncbi:MAG: Stk1 family PASTA domain-containing Ser/Thr kinase, partial [Blautia sp.]|nr:Stk1 family PASTA domain-containing Ser/Thr kinase [Blautia sp.]
MLKTGMIIAERYEIAGKIGAGGMADVYKAKDHKLNRYVAVKVLKAEFRQDASFVKKFRSEAQAAAGLTHPNIVSVFDVGDDDGVYYIVMELIEGITLKEYILKKGKLSVKEATSIAIQVCMGLEAAHNHGIVHRDVKPQNIIISNDGKVKVTDFGIARAASSNTISSNVMGSVHYSSPEQVRGGYSDEKSDIYSLGITLYEMVTGQVPFDGDTTVAIAIKHLQEEMTPPTAYTPELPFSLEQIIFKCTQKSVGRRYDRMEEIIADLKHSLVDPGGDFVKQAGQSPKSDETKVLSREDIKQIRKNKAAATVTTEEEEEGRGRKAKDTGRRSTSSGSSRRGTSRSTPVRGSGYALPVLALIAGVAMLVAIIIMVGRSAGLISSEGKISLMNENGVPTPVPQSNNKEDEKVE